MGAKTLAWPFASLMDTLKKCNINHGSFSTTISISIDTLLVGAGHEQASKMAKYSGNVDAIKTRLSGNELNMMLYTSLFKIQAISIVSRHAIDTSSKQGGCPGVSHCSDVSHHAGSSHFCVNLIQLQELADQKYLK